MPLREIDLSEHPGGIEKAALEVERGTRLIQLMDSISTGLTIHTSEGEITLLDRGDGLEVCDEDLTPDGQLLYSHEGGANVVRIYLSNGDRRLHFNRGGAAAPRWDTVARFPVPYRTLSHGNGLNLAEMWHVSPAHSGFAYNPSNAVPFSNGSSGGTGVSIVFRQGSPGLPNALQQTSTAGVSWATSMAFPWLELLALGLGGSISDALPFPEATRVHWLRLYFQWLSNPDKLVGREDGGYFFTPYNGSTLGGATVIQPGSLSWAAAFGLVGRLGGSGQQGAALEWYDPSGAVTRQVDVPDSILDGAGAQRWTYADLVLVNGKEGSPARLIVSVNGTEVASQDMDNVTFFTPDQMTAGGGYTNAYMYGLHIGGQGTASNAVRTRMEIRSGLYLPDGSKVEP